MATIPIKCILIIILASVVGCNCQTDNSLAFSSRAKQTTSEISPKTLSSMKYGNFRIDIYEHVDNHKATTTASEKKYFYSPLALLDHTSAVSSYNKFTKQPEMRFRIEMWNDKVENEVVKYLNEVVGYEIKSNKVTVIPLEKVLLISKRATQDYFLSPEWTNYDKSKTLWFSLSCYDQKICDELAREMRSDPKHLDHFKLLYSLSSQTSQTKQTTISIDSLTSGTLVSTLLQKFKDKKEIFLTASDEKKMLTETATNIRMDTFDDYEVVSPDTESQILNILKDLLVTSRTTIKEQSDKMWDSVFWNEDNYRPDKMTKTLNEIIKKLDTETQKKLADMFQKVEKQSVMFGKLTLSNNFEKRREEQIRDEKWELATNQTSEENKNFENKGRFQHNFDSNSWADMGRISSTISEKMSNDSDSLSQFEILKEDVDKLLEESKNHIQWDGEKFVPKPMQLSRINLDQFRDSQSFQDRHIRVRYTNAELSAPIKIMEHAELTVTDEWNNLKEGLKATTELLTTTVKNLEKTNQELSIAKNDLTNTRIDLTNEIEGTKKELRKTKIELEETRANVDNLSIKLNETKKELVKTRADIIKTVDELSAKLNVNSDLLGQELKVAEDMKKDLRATSNDLETAKINLVSTRMELNSTKSAVADLVTKLYARTSEIVDTRTNELEDIGRMPTSCEDLQRTGHKLSGFFSVKGSKKMEMIYCNFLANQNDKQKWIGYADVKSTPVHFYVQRNSPFNTTGTPIPFDLALVNEGNAMDLTTGKFTAPRPGIYFFSFAGLASLESSSSYVYFYSRLYLNGNLIGSSSVYEGNAPVFQYDPVTIQSTLNLKKGDQLWVQIQYTGSDSYLDDSGDHFTHFTGFLLEEEIVAAL